MFHTCTPAVILHPTKKGANFNFGQQEFSERINDSQIWSANATVTGCQSADSDPARAFDGREQTKLVNQGAGVDGIISNLSIPIAVGDCIQVYKTSTGEVGR